MADDFPPELHELQSDIMEQLWSQGEGTVRDVLDAINGRTGNERAYTTVLTVMQRLHRKGLLERRRSGAGHVYAATLSRDEYAAARAQADVEAVVSQYGDLALAQFSRQMSLLDAERRKEIRRLARRVR